MNETHNISMKEVKPKMMFEDIEIEDIPFKAINEGLGFHHNAKNNVNEMHIHKKVYEKAINKVEENTRSIPAELNAFYNAKTITPKVNREISLAEAREREAGLLIRLSSFVVDILITILFCSSLLMLMFVSTNLSLKQFLLEISSYPVVFFPIVLMVLLYNVYAIAFGFTQTIGQRIFSLKNKYNDNSSVLDICKRTQLELISILVLGIPYLFKFDAKLFQNKVVSK